MSSPEPPTPAGMPTQVGPYRIVERIGEGGMGVVYSAEQTHPVRRRVALKMMQPGLGGADVVARFEAERQALAVMDHPGIARVLDAGVSEEGRPYFVMELVRGLRIDEYCDRFRLTAPERIELFIALCDAVQHAHQKGVIHRDLKPSNILVTEQDGRPVPKVIDFGVAKALARPLAEEPFMTSHGQALGTLAYMSPEQAEGSGLDVDTRADVYSLGVILYELLVGVVPVDPLEAGMARFIAQLVSPDVRPPLPGERLSGREDTDRMARSRGTDAQAHRRSLRGDIQWIVMRAIEKDRSRRYETANGLKLDLLRYLNDQPITARPPTARYRLLKFVRRNRAAVTAGALAVLVLVAGTIATTVGLVRALRAEAEAREAQVAARLEAQSAEQVVDFLVNLFEVSDPGEALGSTVTARELLDRGARRVESELGGQPLVQARMLTAIGTVYRKLGLLDEAVLLLSRAVRLVEENGGPEDAQLAEALSELGTAQRQRGDNQAAEQSFRRVLAIHGGAEVDSHEVAHALSALASTHLEQGRLEEAEPLLQRALAFEESDPGSDHPQLGTIINDLGALALYRGDFLRAEQYFRRAATIRERQGGPSHPDLASTLMNLGVAYYYQERYEEALDAYRRSQAIYETSLDPTHPRIAGITNNIAEVYWRLGRYADAERLFLDALRLKERALAPDNASIATTLLGLANVYRDQGRFADAGPRYRRAIQIVEQVFGAGHLRLREPLREYAAMLRAAGRDAEAEAVETRAAALGAGS